VTRALRARLCSPRPERSPATVGSVATNETVTRVAQKAVQQELHAWGRVFRDVDAALAAPPTDSPWAEYLAWETRAPKVLAKTSCELRAAARRALKEALSTAGEHARAACRLLDHPLLAVPALAAARNAHDALLPVLWVADPALSPGGRLVRLAAHYLDYVQEHHRFLVAFERVVEGVLVNEALSQLNEAQETLERAGLTLRRHGTEPQYVVHLTLGGDRADLRFKPTDAARTYTPGLARQYAVASGATHTRMWLTPGMRIGGADTSAAIVLPLFDLADYLGDGLLPLVGMDARPMHLATHRRRTAIHETARPNTGHRIRLGYEDFAERREDEARRSTR